MKPNVRIASYANGADVPDTLTPRRQKRTALRPRLVSVELPITNTEGASAVPLIARRAVQEDRRQSGFSS